MDKNVDLTLAGVELQRKLKEKIGGDKAGDDNLTKTISDILNKLKSDNPRDILPDLMALLESVDITLPSQLKNSIDNPEEFRELSQAYLAGFLGSTD